MGDNQTLPLPAPAPQHLRSSATLAAGPSAAGAGAKYASSSAPAAVGRHAGSSDIRRNRNSDAAESAPGTTCSQGPPSNGGVRSKGPY